MDALLLAISNAGGVSKLASALRVNQTVISNWKARGKVPAERCPAVETATGVRCEDLRPDLTWLRNEAGEVTGYCVRFDP